MSKHSLKNVWEILKVMWSLDKVYFVVSAVQGIASTASTLLNIFLIKTVIDGVLAGWSDSVFLQTLAVFAALKFIMLIVKAYTVQLNFVHIDLLQHKMIVLLSKKVLDLDYDKLEDPDVLDLKERALFPITNFGAIYELLHQVAAFGVALMTFVGVFVILLSFSVWFTLGIALITSVTIYMSIRQSVRMKDSFSEVIPINRRYGYYAGLVTDATHQKEFRLYDMDELIVHRVDGFLDKTMAWFRKMNIMVGNSQSAINAVTGVATFLTYAYTGVRVVTASWGPQIGLGNFSMYINATTQFSDAMKSMVNAVTEIFMMAGYLEPTMQLLGLENRGEIGGKEVPGHFETLRFENVVFQYPNTERVILDDVSFELKKGEKISIVGLNNAGKSTVVKLICRFFEPDAGRILWNGKDIRTLDHALYMEELSTVFQDFHLFPFSIAQNLTEDQANDERLLQKVDMWDKVAKLPKGLESMLDKKVNEEGVDFSGGERQKIAIARALGKDYSLIILDEPTAALDPLAESEIYEKFHDLTRGQTAIFISHRMSSSLFCDKVLVLQDGKVQAYDSHQNLMKTKNLYRELFETQAKNYQLT